METICMKCQNLFSRKNKKNILLSSAENFTQSAKCLRVKPAHEKVCKLTKLDMTLMGWLGHKTSTQTNIIIHALKFGKCPDGKVVIAFEFGSQGQGHRFEYC